MITRGLRSTSGYEIRRRGFSHMTGRFQSVTITLQVMPAGNRSGGRDPSDTTVFERMLALAPALGALPTCIAVTHRRTAASMTVLVID